MNRINKFTNNNDLTVTCPLSKSSDVILIEKIKTTDLVKRYKKLLQADIGSEFISLDEIGFYFCPECELKFFYPPATGSEAFYEILQEFGWYYMDEKNEYNYAKGFINKTDVVLEIGCGKGAFREIINNPNYTCLEFSKKAVDLSKKRGINVLNESVQEHSIRSANKYDVVCSFQVLEHVNNIQSFIESCIACLKPGGLLINSVPSADSFLSIVENGILNMPPHHVSWWSDNALMNVADIYNLEVVGLEHEKLADIHRKWYASTVVSSAICSFFKRKNKLIDTSISGRIVNKFAWILGHFYGFGIMDPRMRPYGHSVTVVYRKNKHGHR